MRRATILVSSLWLTVGPRPAGERLPLRVYTTADGLPNNNIRRIVRDSRGFLWFCTPDGISRFDGYQFTNFGSEQSGWVAGMLETPGGKFWLAAEQGMIWFDPDASGKARFTVYNRSGEPAAFHALVGDGAGGVWCGASKGLYHLDPGPGAWSLRGFASDGSPINGSAGGVPVLLS